MTTTRWAGTRQEFGTAKKWRWFIYLLVPPMVLLFLAMPFLMWDKSPQLGPALGFGAVGGGVALLFLYILIETIKARHIITADSLIYQGAFRRKQLPLANIKGYRIANNYLYLQPATEADPAIRIGHTSEQYDYLQAWFAARYPDLNKQEQAQDAARLLQDEEVGRTAAGRHERWQEARRLAGGLNVAGSITGLWLWFYPYPYQAAVGAGLVVPLLAVAALWLYQGVLRPDEKPNSAYPSLLLPLLAPGLLLLLRVFEDINLLAYAPLWPVAGTATVIFALLLLVGSRSFIFHRNGQVSLFISVGIYAALYGPAAVIMYNCAFDENPGTYYAARVAGRHITSGKTNTYYLQLTPWGPDNITDEAMVTADVYEQKQVGDPVRVMYKPGQLNIPWFTVDD